MSSSSSSNAVKRACDACHRRKVKCIGEGTKSCRNCLSSGLSCTYNAVPQKKGPKGSRAKVISELRETQRQSQLAAQRYALESPPSSPAHARQPGLLSPEVVSTCVDYYFANLYPSQPILDRRKFAETITQMDTDTEAYCLVVSLCAYMLIQPGLIVPQAAFESLDSCPQSSLHFGHTLLQEVIRVRKGLDYIENHTVWSVITSFFLFGCYFSLDRQNLAWFHLREASTLAHLLGMHEEESYKTCDVVDSSRRRRLYWLLFCTERAYALQQHRPLTLHATINLPTLDDDPSETAGLSGFIHLVKLFRPFDDTFVGLWNKTRNGATSSWLSQLQQQLSEALPTYLQCTETQAVDLKISLQWLRTMVWQLSISHGFLSSAAADNAMSFKFPIEISRDLVNDMSQFSQQTMEVHGIGLIEKLFDVACTLTDVISCVPTEENSFEFSPRDYLSQLMTLISNLRGGQQRFMPLLASKINDTMSNAPSYAFPMMSTTESSKLSDFCGSSQDAGSTPNSSDSTPFGSPPMSAAGPPPPGFGTFQNEVGLADLSTPSVLTPSVLTPGVFPTMVMSTGISYADIAVSTPMQIFAEGLTYSAPTPLLKLEDDG